MDLSRRELILLAGAVTIAGCAHSDGGARVSGMAADTNPMDAGPLADFAAEGAYDRFASSHGFFVVREGPTVFAPSATCTHRACLLSAAGEGFRCKCHGSMFTLDGHVTRGPARRNLPRLAVERSPDGHLIVHVERPPLAPEQFNAPQAFVVTG